MNRRNIHVENEGHVDYNLLFLSLDIEMNTNI